MTTALECPRCGAELGEDAPACSSCGLPFSGAGSVDLVEITAEREKAVRIALELEEAARRDVEPSESKVIGTLGRKSRPTDTPTGMPPEATRSEATDVSDDEAHEKPADLTVTAIASGRDLPLPDGTTVPTRTTSPERSTPRKKRDEARKGALKTKSKPVDEDDSEPTAVSEEVKARSDDERSKSSGVRVFALLTLEGFLALALVVVQQILLSGATHPQGASFLAITVVILAAMILASIGAIIAQGRRTR